MFYLNEQHSLAIKEKHKWNSSQCTSCGKCEVSIPLPPSSSFDVVVTQPLRNPTTRPRSQAASRRASRAVSMEASMEASMAATGPARDAPSPTAPPTRRATRPPGASPPGPSHSIPQGMPKTSLYGRKTSWPMWRRYKIETVWERERPLPIIDFWLWKHASPITVVDLFWTGFHVVAREYWHFWQSCCWVSLTSWKTSRVFCKTVVLLNIYWVQIHLLCFHPCIILRSTCIKDSHSFLLDWKIG